MFQMTTGKAELPASQVVIPMRRTGGFTRNFGVVLFLRQPVKTQFSLKWRIVSWDCLVGSSPRSSNWPPYVGWNKGFDRRSGAGFGGESEVLPRWRREFRHGPSMRFPAMGSCAGRRGGLRSWSDSPAPSAAAVGYKLSQWTAPGSFEPRETLTKPGC